MKLIYLHIYKDTYSIFMQVYKSLEHIEHKKIFPKKEKIIHSNNLKSVAMSCKLAQILNMCLYKYVNKLISFNYL